MNQQVAELHVGIAHVGTKHVLAEEVIKLTARRMLFKERAVLMARAGKGAVTHFNVLSQGIKKRRQQLFFIATGGGFQLQPLLFFTADDRIYAVWGADIIARQHKYRQLKSAAFE